MLYSSEEEFESVLVTQLERSSRPACSAEVLESISELSRAILNSTASQEFPDLASFGFFCRNSNVKRYASRWSSGVLFRGLGGILHVAPGNIPMNFAYSWVMGLVAGNQNYVRLPSTRFPQAEVFLDILESSGVRRRLESAGHSSLFFRSKIGSPVFDELVASVDGLVVWGGDRTVEKIRALKKKPLCREVYFPSRVSSAILSAEQVLSLDSKELRRLAVNFYNDTFVVDQAACSSPSVVFWVGDSSRCERAREGFWRELSSVVREKWRSRAPTGVRKTGDLFEMVVRAESKFELEMIEGLIYLTRDNRIIGENLRFGFFVEVFQSDLAEIAGKLRANEQTISYFGLDPNIIESSLQGSGAAQVERICRIGKALEMEFIWDGKDTLPLLARRILID